MLRPALIGLLVFAASACATAPRSGTEAAADPASQGGTPQAEKICRDMSTTGSYGPRHVCHTKEQWDKIDALS